MAEAVATVWYRNTDTGLDWEIEKGSDHERDLRAQRNDDDEPLYQKVSAPKPPKPPKPTTPPDGGNAAQGEGDGKPGE